MHLDSSVGSDYSDTDFHPTSGFILEPFSVSGAISKIPVIGILGKRDLPYVAHFHILAKPLSTDETEVTVRTIVANVIDGSEPGVHVRWANHYRKVAPVRQEEVNVLSAISEQLTKSK